VAFSGTELEEVAPTTVGTTCAGGGKVFAIGQGQIAIMDDATSEAYLYSSPGDNAWNTSGLLRHCVERVLLCNIQSVVWDDRNLPLYHGGGHHGVRLVRHFGQPLRVPLLGVPLLSQHCDHRRLRVGRMGAVNDLISVLLGQVDDLHL